MIIEYHKPHSIQQALELLSRPEPRTVPLGGGTVLSSPSPENLAVVDLQYLGLNRIEQRGSFSNIGATVTLQTLLEFAELQPDLHKAVRHEASYNLRQVGTLAGTLMSSDGRSPLAAALLALDAKANLLPTDEKVDLGDLLIMRDEILKGSLITSLNIQLRVALSYQYVARTPADLPIVSVAAARWPSGRLRIVVGGFGDFPKLSLDAPEPGGVDQAVRNVTAIARDQWGSSEYRQAVALVLTRRAVKELE